MKWPERHGQTIETALFCLIAFGIAGILVLNLMLATKSYGASCLSVDVPPQAVLGVMDGDTFSVFNLFPPGYVKIRVKGVNAPERGKPGFEEARRFTAQWLAEDTFRVQTCGKHTFERIVATVERNGISLAASLIEMGYGKP